MSIRAARGIFLIAMACAVNVVVSAQGDLKIRPQDTLAVTVADQPDLTSKYVVSAEGEVTFPLIGPMQAAGLTAQQLGAEIQRRLTKYFKDPSVRISVERQRHVFVFGGVTAPGMYQLTDEMTLIEVLARAGYGSAAEALIVRTKDAKGPVLPGDNGSSQVIRVNLREFESDLEKGKLSRNVVLDDGDTIYVPRRDPNRIYVSGQVRSPGAFSIPEGTTVLQALALAGGPTEHAKLGKIKVMRLVNGTMKTLTVKLEDIVRPGDTIIVPERFF
jgi:polysaccharide export outer membrane protein